MCGQHVQAVLRGAPCSHAAEPCACENPAEAEAASCLTRSWRGAAAARGRLSVGTLGWLGPLRFPAAAPCTDMLFCAACQPGRACISLY